MRKTPKTHIEQKKWFWHLRNNPPNNSLSKNLSIIEILTRLRLCPSVRPSSNRKSNLRGGGGGGLKRIKKTSSDFSSIIFGRAREHACIVALRSIRKKVRSAFWQTKRPPQNILKNKTLAGRTVLFFFFFNYFRGGGPMNKILEWSLCSIKPQ